MGLVGERRALPGC